MSDYEVIVIGGGGAGLCAALSSADGGARTLLIEADSLVGGAARLSGGIIYAAGTSVQRARGVEDSAEAMFLYYMTLNQYQLNPGLIRRLCGLSGPTVEWLIGLGVDYDPELLYDAGLDGTLRGHYPVGRGEQVVQILDKHVSEHPLIDVALSTRTDQLRVKDGRVSGVFAGGHEVSSEMVILAAGGFSANRDLIDRFLPATSIYGDRISYIGSKLAQGDGITMAQAVGADATGLDSVVASMTSGLLPDFEPLLPPWLVLVDLDGVRYCDENQGYELIGLMTRQLPRGEAYAIFDERGRKEATRIPMKRGPDTPSWKADFLGKMADEGRIARAETLQALGDIISINGDRLAGTITQYNHDCVHGLDQSYFKDADYLLPIETGPFYAVPVRPSVVGITGAGLKVDRDMRVMSAAGEPIPGLLAAGETVGGVLGKAYVGGGGSLLNAFTFGRLAGQLAADPAFRTGS